MYRRMKILGIIVIMCYLIFPGIAEHNYASTIQSTHLSPDVLPSIRITAQHGSLEFPLKNGWLGGDGDVSVSINDTTTLFLFSDTYVGKTDNATRQNRGLNMVSNSVGILRHLPGGATEISYFWNNKFSKHPKAIFESNTNQFRYWVNDAFVTGGSLYAVLVEVGPKPDALPGEIFSFSLLGFTLAKVSNPLESPELWKIEYNHIPGFGNPSLGLQCHAIQENYLYLFASRHDTALVLLRKQLDMIDDLRVPFEYYALDMSWKRGLDTLDMASVVSGFRSNTVNYHSEISQWVMISDIPFMDNKIKMRTSSELTGPWSEEKVIYEIPEVTPGNPLYKRSNFCYLARECFQFYDSANHTMLITYDINHPDIGTVISNPYIYTPKVISVSLGF